jgi:hypothetical protein
MCTVSSRCTNTEHKAILRVGGSHLKIDGQTDVVSNEAKSSLKPALPLSEALRTREPQIATGRYLNRKKLLLNDYVRVW